MISKNYSSKILNTLMGMASGTLEAPSYVYLGLCANEPDATTGSIANAGEPSDVASYARKEVSGKSATTRCFGVSTDTGVIKNNTEIQLKTAREDYPEKINYWFLSTSSSKGSGNAYLWGKIKDVLSNTKTVSGFVVDDARTQQYGQTVYAASITTDSLLGLKAGEDYIISWGGVDHDEKAILVEMGDKSYIGFGSALSSGKINEEAPYVILYSEETTGVETTGNMTVYSLSTSPIDVAIYSVGIEVKKATVPTFYENELQASIDV